MKSNETLGGTVAPVHFSGQCMGWVSIWVGDFRDEMDLDGYLGTPFDRDHGTQRTHDGEYDVKPEPLAIEALLSGFYLSRMWLDAALAVASAAGVTGASCAVVRMHYRHAPAAAAPGPRLFLGSVPFGEAAPR